MLLISLVIGISGCASSSATCPECGSTDVRDAGPYTDPITDEEMQGYICNDCETSFGVPI